MAGYGIVVVGTSWGGLAALRTIVQGLPADFPLPVVLVQHRHRSSDALLARLLQERTRMPVCEVEDKMPICGGQIFVAPPDYHLLVDEGSFALTTDAPVRYSRPSIDVTFSSAADVFAERTVGVVLTGANADGSEGLRRISDRGGVAVVQQPETAESTTMPAQALLAVPNAIVLSVMEIAPYLATVADHTAVRGHSPRFGTSSAPHMPQE
jgi:two-component system, chemotaxis family, protein-glutamate methylesterase/glutaminase